MFGIWSGCEQRELLPPSHPSTSHSRPGSFTPPTLAWWSTWSHPAHQPILTFYDIMTYLWHTLSIWDEVMVMTTQRGPAEHCSLSRIIYKTSNQEYYENSAVRWRWWWDLEEKKIKRVENNTAITPLSSQSGCHCVVNRQYKWYWQGMSLLRICHQIDAPCHGNLTSWYFQINLKH